MVSYDAAKERAKVGVHGPGGDRGSGVFKVRRGSGLGRLRRGGLASCGRSSGQVTAGWVLVT
jgi:hypothetical protein